MVLYFIRLFSVSLQKKFLPRLKQLLFNPLSSLQRTAVSVLSQFDDELVLVCFK